MVGSRIFALAPMLINVEPDSHCQAVLDIMPGPSRDSSWWNQRRDLYTLLQRFSQSQASDPRDMIYALLGISSNKTDVYNLQPDYTKSTEEVIDDATSFLFGLPPCSFRTMDKFLGNFTFLTTQAFIAIARSGNATDVFNFLEDRGPQINIGTTELVAAAANKQFGAGVMEILCIQPGVFITEPVIAAAIKNTGCGPKILQLLIQPPDYRVRKLVTDLIVTAAVLNTGCGRKFYRYLKDCRDPEINELTRATVAQYVKSGMGVSEDFLALQGEQLITATVHAENIATLESLL